MQPVALSWPGDIKHLQGRREIGFRGRWRNKIRHENSGFRIGETKSFRSNLMLPSSAGTRKAYPDQSMDCSSLPGLNRTALPGGMETSAPVRGLRPIPVLRGRTLNTPNPRSSIRSERASAFFMLSKTVSTASSALVLVMPVRATTSLMMSSLITRGSRIRGQDVPQVIDAMGDNGDCQREHLPRKLAGALSGDDIKCRAKASTESSLGRIIA